MKRITVSKKDQIAELIERIIEEPERDIVIVIPKGSALAGSVSNFHLLAREALAAEKDILIESVDEAVLALAQASNLQTRHPLLDGPVGGALADIVPRVKAKKTSGKKSEKASIAVQSAIADQESIGTSDDKEIDIPERPRRTRRGSRLNLKFFVILAIIVLIAWVGVLIVDQVFGKATVAITFNKTPWSYQKNIVADVSVSAPDIAKGVIPAAIFTLPKNTTQLYPASGKAYVSQKATGKMLIWNAYSSSPQSLVATTRFETPDGKIFRITDGVTVPGAQISNGKIVPSSIEVDIVADQAGPAYNVGPIAKLTIPGFKSTPKYDGFYGQINGSITDGFVGQRAVPTDADVAAAKDKATQLLKTALQSAFTAAYPPGIVIPNGGSSISVTRVNVNKNTDDQGNFSVFVEGTMTAIGFKEDDIKNTLLGLADADNPGTVFKDLALSYDGASPDFLKKTMSFMLSATGTLWTDFQTDTFVEDIAKKSLGEARSTVAQIPGLTTAKISVWPVWLGGLPDASKIKVMVN